MEAQATFVRANGIVVLDAVPHVSLYVALVINPVDAELNDAIGDAQPLNKIGAVELRVFVVLFLDRSEHLAHGLDILGLVGKTLLQASYYFCCFHNLGCFLYWMFKFALFYLYIIMCQCM